MNASVLIRRLAKRLNIEESEAREFFYVLVEEMKDSAAHLEEIRFPSFGKLVPRLGLRSGGRKQPKQPECALCNNGTKATPRHIATVHKMVYGDYCEEYGGVTWVGCDGTQQVYITFKLFRGAREDLLSRGPLKEILEDDHGSPDRKQSDVGQG